MAQVNKISSFKSFSEIKNQEATMKLREKNNAKRQETVGKIGAILDEMGLTSLSELDEDKKQALISKMFGNVSEDEAEDIEDEINKLGEPEKLEEGNAFIFAASKARQEGKDEFEFNGKKYKVTLKKDTGLKEGNSFGDAVKKAKEDGETEFEFEGETYKVEESLNEGSHGMAKKILQSIVNGDSSRAEGIKMSKDLADHYLHWINSSPFGKKNENLPLYMLVKASFNWGIERGLDSKLKGELETLKSSIKESVESVESIDEARSISKIQNEWSKLTTTMQATAQNWKAAEGSAKEMLLGKLKEMTAQKKALESELEEVIADKDKDLELAVSEAFFRLPKDVIGTELYTANQNMQSLYSRIAAGNDIDTKDIDVIIKLLQQVKSLTKKFNNKEEVLGTVYEGKGFKNTEDFEAFLEEIDGMGESAIKKIMGKDYIDTPGGYSEEAEDYDNDIVEYMISNMGRKEFEKLQDWWESNVVESVVTEAAVKQFDADFNDMVKNIKSGYGWIDPEYVADTWENSSDSIDFELVKGEIYKRLIAAKLLAYADDEDEESAGKYVKSLKELGIKESIVIEAKINEEDINSDDQFKEYAMTVLKGAFKDDFDEAKANDVIDGILGKVDGDYGAAVGMLTSSLGESVTNEGFDANYWEDYHEKSTKITSASKVARAVEDAVEDWNDNNEDGEDNEVTNGGEKKVLNLAHDFFKAKGWISSDVIEAMIAQES